MVSLINFKIVNEELRGGPGEEEQQQQQPHQFISANHNEVQRSADSKMFINVVQPQDSINRLKNQTNKNNIQMTTTISQRTNKSKNLQLTSSQQTRGIINQKTDKLSNRAPNIFNQLPPPPSDNPFAPDSLTPPPPPSSQQAQQVTSCCAEAPNFVVTWRNLSFMIEPKWHQKVVNASPIGALTSSGKSTVSDQQTSSGRAAQPNQPQQSSNSVAQPSAQNKIVLDRLDGSFRSGELTAILGPSGAGKTTLLDCLTGHRKSGLHGSIKISSSTCPLNKCHYNHQQQTNNSNNNNNNNSSSSSSNNTNNQFLNANHHHQQLHATSSLVTSAYGKQQVSSNAEPNHLDNNNRVASFNGARQRHQIAPPSPATGGDNLKVSIIPQNDHLMGHLTVYETLNYASKMKNCFHKQFNHKLNIRRVAQQLGLVSCLGTRINKLSGGQYKRVSIAQELLSSPDILILDEPTSGLDAMTCYQTVQVLRQLTDDRRASGQNQIAVILTIHQPNSDVFQQFNHVYVVAQGGKCIYEGSPASIESVINRVGIRLPSSYYNPATMIVEIAAGKFGLEPIQKLNSIQKKQYDFVVPDEQNSTGDSAVDCPTSSSSSSNGDDDDDDHRHHHHHPHDHGVVPNAGQPLSAIRQTMRQDDNNNIGRPICEINNNIDSKLPMGPGGLVNKGFVMSESEETAHNNDSGSRGARDVIVDVPKLTYGAGGCEDADSVDKIKMSNGGGVESNIDSEGRRKKRRRTRKRSGDHQANNSILANISSQADSTLVACPKFAAVSGGGGGGNGSPSSRQEKRLKLNSLKADQMFPFWRHTYLHFHRSWLSIVRDPMLCSMQLALHIIVPVMVSLVYGTNVGKPNACPRAGPMDIMAYALEPTDSALQLQEDLRTTLENIGYIFFKLYGIIFAAMTVTVLTFPLDMHVLVKEFRNGWYGLSSYFLGRTLADIPFQLTLPLLAMSLSYYATGQPYSYMQWRFLSITGILILSSLIAQSQGLLFGAILMDKMKAAVFVAPAATTPIILFAGFLVRTQSIPRYLRPLSNLSYLRYAIEACLISRYGFNQCECDPAIFNQTVPELPPIARSMLDYWLSSFKASSGDNHDLASAGHNSSSAELETTTFASASNPDLFTKLIDSLAKANSFGRNITSCEQVVPYPMIDYDLKDSQLFNCFAILLFMLVFTRLLTFFIVCFKVKRKV